MALECSICDAVFDNRDELDDHEQLHQQLDCLSRDIANYELHSPLSLASSTNSPLHCKKTSPSANDTVKDSGTTISQESSGDSGVTKNDITSTNSVDIVKKAIANAGLAIDTAVNGSEGASSAMETESTDETAESAKDTADSGVENSVTPVDFSPVTSPPTTSTEMDPSELTVSAMAAALGLIDPIVSLETLPPPYITRHSIDLDFLGPHVTVPKSPAKCRRNRVRKPALKRSNKRVPLRRRYTEETELFDLVAYPVSKSPRKTDPVRDRLMERVGKLNSDLLTKVVSMNRGILNKLVEMDTALLRKLTSMDEDVLSVVLNLDRQVLEKIAQMEPTELKSKLSRTPSNDWKLNVQPNVVLNRVASTSSQKLTRSNVKKNHQKNAAKNTRGKVSMAGLTNGSRVLPKVPDSVATGPVLQRTKPKKKRRQKWTMKRRPNPIPPVKKEDSFEAETEPDDPPITTRINARSIMALKKMKRGLPQPAMEPIEPPRSRTRSIPKLVLKMKRMSLSKPKKSCRAKPYSRPQPMKNEGNIRTSSRRPAPKAPKEIPNGQIQRSRRNCTRNKKYDLEDTLDTVQKTADTVTNKRPKRGAKKSAHEIQKSDVTGWDANMNEETMKDLIASCTNGKAVVMVSKMDETEILKMKTVHVRIDVFNDDDDASSMDGILTDDLMAQLDEYDAVESGKKLDEEALAFCDFCGDQPENLEEHSLEHGNESSPYQCGLCSRHFVQRSQYARHVRSYHTREKHLKCPYCPGTFKSLNFARFEAHIRSEHNAEHVSEKRKQFSCQFCESKFDSSWTYNVHCNSHSEKENYSCDNCDVTLHEVDEFLTHSKEHENCQDSQPMVQSEHEENSSEVEENSNDVEIEKTEREGEKTCEFCGFVTMSEFQRHSHLILNHSSKCCKCPFCVIVCDSQENLQKHLTETHPKYQNLMCSHCGALFENSDELRIHEKKHRTNFACKPCGKKFATRVAQIQHRICHHSKRFKCATCTAVFSSRKKFSLHRCRSKKSIPCQDCDQTFKYSNDLKLHLMNEHIKIPLNVENPPSELFLHYCTICSEGFSYKRHLKRHQAEMHSE